jgi:hypothetical protein
MRLWSALPAGETISEARAFELILESADRWSGDDAWASGMLATLRGMGALTVTTGGGVRRSDDWPQLEDLIPGRPAYEQLREAENKAAREREIQNENETYRLRWEASPEGRQRRELGELIDDRVDEVVKERLAEVADEVIEERLDVILRRFEPESMKQVRERLGTPHRAASEDEQGA